MYSRIFSPDYSLSRAREQLRRLKEIGGSASQILELEKYLEDRILTQYKTQENRRTLLKAISENDVALAEKSFEVAIRKGEINTTREGLSALKTSDTKISISNFIILAIDLNQEKIVELLSLFYLSQSITEPQEGLKQRIFYYAIKRSIVSLVKVLLTPAHFSEINLEKEDADDIYDGGTTALYYAIETRQTALAERQSILTNNQQNPTDKNLENTEVLRLKFANNAYNAKTMLHSDLIVLLLLNVGADFGYQSSYTPQQITTIEDAKGTYITLLYRKSIEAGLQKFPANVTSIISEYTTPDYTSHPEAPSHQPTCT
jgi:hypothetical protein